MNKNYICVLDFETGSPNCKTCPVLSLAAIVLHPRTLEPIRNNGEIEEFYSLIKPPKGDFSKIEQGALNVNKLTMEEIENAPEEEQVWAMFVNFVKKFNKGSSQWDFPIAAGYNIANFDLPIIERLCNRYKTINKDRQNLFHPRDFFDVMNEFIWWFESNPDIKSYSLDNMRTYLGMPKDKDALIGEVMDTHNAKRDTRDTAAILKKMIMLKRNLQENYNIKFKDAFYAK